MTKKPPPPSAPAAPPPTNRRPVCPRAVVRSGATWRSAPWGSSTALCVGPGQTLAQQHRTSKTPAGLGGRTVRCARAVRKVGHSPPPVGSFLGVGLPQGTIA